MPWTALPAFIPPVIPASRAPPMQTAACSCWRIFRGKPRPWLAHFHAAIAIALPGGEVRIAEGDCPGEIIPEERGSNGFGYDPIFLLSERGLTMAELGNVEKNRLSHRARAVANAEPILKEVLGI